MIFVEIPDKKEKTVVLKYLSREKVQKLTRSHPKNLFLYRIPL